MVISSRSTSTNATSRLWDVEGIPAAAARTAAAPLALSSAPGLLRTLSRWARTSNVFAVIGAPRVATMFTPDTGAHRS